MRYSTRIFFTVILFFTGFVAKAVTADFTVSASIGCAPMVVSFTNISIGATSYDWDFGDGSSHLTTTSPTHTFSSVGTYNVILTAYSSSGSSSSKTYTIHVYDAPTVYFRASDTAICICNSVSFFDSSVLNAPGTGTYEWQFGNGDTSALHNPTYPGYCTANTTGYTVILKVTNSAGCFSSLSKPYYVRVYSHPTINFSGTPTTICGLYGTVSFTSSISGGPSPYTYQWDFGDGSSPSASANPFHSYTSTTFRSYDVGLIVTTRAGCKDTIVKTSYINLTHVVAAIVTTPLSGVICANEYLTAENHAVPSFDSTSWIWGDGNVTGNNPDAHMYAASGTYRLTLVTKNGTCIDSTYQNITVRPVPVVKFGATPLNPCAAPQTIYFTDSSTGASTHRWDFGDTTGSTSTSPPHTYMHNGIYDVKLVCTNSYGCMDSLTKYAYIKIYPLQIEIKGNTQTGGIGGCLPFTVNFTRRAIYTDASSGSTITYPYGIDSTWWDFGDTSTSISANPTHIYHSYGTFHVKVRIKTLNGCYALDSFTVKTGPHPTANFSASPTTACVHQAINFTNLTDTATDYEWHFGDDGGINFTKDPIYRYNDTGHFTVMLIATNNGCPDTMTKTRYITVNVPVAIYEYKYSCDTFNMIHFIDHSKGADTYDWDFGDGSTHSNAAAPSHLYPSTGTYTIKLVVYNTATGCHDTSTMGIIIYNPSVSFTADDTVVCKDVPVTFRGSVAGGIPVTKYYWIYDNSVLFADTTITMPYTFTTTGLHTAKFIALDVRNCQDSLRKVNYIKVVKPVANFSALSTNGCQPFTALFSDLSTDASGVSITTRHWTFGDTTTGTGAPVSHTYSKSGIYTVSLVVTDNEGCMDSITRTNYITVHKPTADFFGVPITSCPGSPIYFTSTSSGLPLTYVWHFGDGYNGTGVTTTHSYAATGNYNVSLVVTDNSGCKDSVTKLNYIHIITKPTASFTLDDSFSICSPLVVHFTNHSTGATSYMWDFGDPTSTPSTSISPSWTYVNPGVFTVTLVAYNASGCTDTARLTVRLLGYKGAFSYSPLVGCAPFTVNFTVKVDGVPDFIYDFDDGSTYKTPSKTTSHLYTTPGPKVPKLIMTDDAGCSSESIGLDTILVDGVYHGFFVRPYPTCDSGTIQLIDTSKGAYSTIKNHKWIFDDGTKSSLFNPYHSYHAPGTYPILLIDSTSSGCIDTFNTNVTFYNSPIITAMQDTTICLSDSATLSASGAVVYTWTPVATLSCGTCYYPKAGPSVATTYVVVGTDIHGCKGSDSVTVFIKTKTNSIAKGSGEICQGEYIQLNDSGGLGTTYNWVPIYGLNNPKIPNPIANPDTTVLYAAIATQGHCIPDTQYVNVLVHPRPTPDLGPNKKMIAGDGVQLHVAGFNLYKLAWIPTTYLSCDSCADPIATPKDKQAIYTVQAWSDFGCRDSSSITIFVVCDQSQVFMPNAFTPNGDGQNDVFYPRGKGLRIIKSFRIYNRWGQMIFDKQDINTNQKQNGWDGTFKGEAVPQDVYIYIVDAICDTGEPMSWKGDISLIR